MLSCLYDTILDVSFSISALHHFKLTSKANSYKSPTDVDVHRAIPSMSPSPSCIINEEAWQSRPIITWSRDHGRAAGGARCRLVGRRERALPAAHLFLQLYLCAPLAPHASLPRPLAFLHRRRRWLGDDRVVPVALSHSRPPRHGIPVRDVSRGSLF